MTASVDDEQVETLSDPGTHLIHDAYYLQTDAEFNEVKGKVKLVQRRLNRNSEPQASIESGNYTYQYAYLDPSICNIKQSQFLKLHLLTHAY